jgi:hypothetical protein
MPVRNAALILILVLCTSAAFAQDGIRTERVAFQKGGSGATITDTIVGRASVSYILGAQAGQTMTVALKPSNLATYFNVYAPGKGPGDEAIANSGVTGPPTVPEINRFEATLPDSGDYTISVYMMRSAARRNERSDYTLDVAITSASAAGVSPDDALVAGTEFHASGEIPCARYEGQPMASCRFGVIRRGNGDATVRVFWPDDGERNITFEKGAATASDSNAGIASEKRSDLNMVSIGTAERFEIPDAVIYGG